MAASHVILFSDILHNRSLLSWRTESKLHYSRF